MMKANTAASTLMNELISSLMPPSVNSEIADEEVGPSAKHPLLCHRCEEAVAA